MTINGLGQKWGAIAADFQRARIVARNGVLPARALRAHIDVYPCGRTRPYHLPTVKGAGACVDTWGTMRPYPYASRFDSYPSLRRYGRRTATLLGEALALGFIVGAMAVALFY